MQRLTGRYTNFFRDRLVWTGTLVTGGSPTTMAEAIAEIVALHHSAPDLIYWNTVVEHDGPDGGSVVSVIDLGAFADDILNDDIDDIDPEMPGDEFDTSRIEPDRTKQGRRVA